MRTSHVLASVFLLGIFSAPAFADVKSYCATLGQDFASEKSSDVDQWLTDYRSAFSDCIAQYSADATVEPPAKEVAEKTVRKVVVVPARDFSRKKRIPILTPGTIAWNNYCASKYASFNPATGNYKSRTGQQHPCLTPAD